jgi:hypothetical protein
MELGGGSFLTGKTAEQEDHFCVIGGRSTAVRVTSPDPLQAQGPRPPREDDI